MKQRIIGAALSLSVLCQLTAGALPAVPAHAAAQHSAVSFETFAALVQETVSADADKDLFQEIVYDPANGTLSQDGGAAKTEVCGLSVCNGRLALDTGSPAASGGMSVQSGSRYVSFDREGENYGYHTEQRGGLQVITNEFQTARLIVKAAGSIDRHGAVRAVEGWNDLHILQYADSAAAYAAYQSYQADPAVQYVQPSRRIVLDTQASEADLTGLDTGAYNTWGADLIGTADFAETYLNAEVLPEVVVAVIDTGLNPAPSIFRDRVIDGGINVSDSGDDTTNDDLYHGTHVSGTICELTPPNVKILPVKVFDVDGSASDEQIYLGLMFALEQGADILNMSFGGLGVSPLEVEAMTIADSHGIICCAAAGNNGDLAEYYYPGGIDSCITVGAVDTGLSRAAFSNRGDLVDVMAPGVGIVSYVLGNAEKTEAKNGTSMATPHVTACCALLKSYETDLTPARAEALLRRNAVDLGKAGFDEEFGWGLVSLKDFQWDDGICYAPEFSRKSGNFGQPQTVSLSSLTPDSEIYYTTDGTVPSAENGTRYTEPLVITETAYVRAVTVRAGYADSVPAEAVYMIGGLDTADAWDIADGTVRRYTGVRSTVQLPAAPDGKPVTAIAEGAFAGNHFIQNVTLPDTVTEIGKEAFADCAALETVTAAHASAVGERAFADDAALRTVTLSDPLTELGAGAFSGCASLTELSAAGIAEIPADCFADCGSLKTVSAPDASVFGDGAFRGCASLTALHCGWTGVTAIGDRAFSGCTAWSGDLRLTALETLGTAAFSGDSSLRRVSLPARITALPKDTFRGCSGLSLLQLPGVTKLGEFSLAVGSVRTAMTAELDYSRVTAVGNSAFYGFPVSDRYETVSFDALETLETRSFCGASAGGLNLPRIKRVPAGEFTDADIWLIYLEQAETLEANCLSGCKSVVLSDAANQIAPNAMPAGTWIVTLDDLTLPEGMPQVNLCAEPLLLAVDLLEIKAAQHTQIPLYLLAGGVGLTYQWYKVSGERQTPIAGAQDAVYYADSSKAGTTVYRCVMTDAGGKTEQTDITVEVTAETEQPQMLSPETPVYLTDAALHRYALTVPETGSWTLRMTGAVPVQAELADAAGRLLTAARTLADGSSACAAQLTAGETYYLDIAARWAGMYELCLTQDTAAKKDIADCKVTASMPQTQQFSKPVQPAVTVTAPDGTVLTAGKDYTVQVQNHNQNRIIAVFGAGSYTGYAETACISYASIPSDTPVPVSLSDSSDRAVFLFVPQTTGTYYYYATYAAGYAEEQLAYNRLGRYVNGSRYVAARTCGIVADTPDGTHTVYAENTYSSVTGTYFCDTVELQAGQPYYIICSAESAAEYQLMVAQKRYDLRDAKVDGVLYGFYLDGLPYFPKVTVTLNGETLTEGVDYQRFHTYTDVPGKGMITVVGMGKYIGRIEKICDIYVYGSLPAEITEVGLEEPVQLTCDDARMEIISFRVNEPGDDPVRYRILNEKLSGGKFMFRLYQYDSVMSGYTLMRQVSSDTNDYLLPDGEYRIVCFRQYAEQKSTARFTVLKPYSLEDAAVTIGSVPYTGSPTSAPITVTAPDGTVLEENRDYKVTYPGNHTGFGTTSFVLRPTNYSYGMRMDTYETVVVLPEDAPELTVGDHEVYVTYDDRLAIYRVTAEEETEYSLSCSDVPDIVLRAFTPEAELLDQDYGNSSKSVTFTVPAGETRYVMVKFNGTDRMGTIHFRLDTELRMLSRCETVSAPCFYTGERVLPQVTFRDGDYTLQEGVDYRLRYTVDDVNLGTATANYIGMGAYFGLCDVRYDIIAEDLFAVEDADRMPVQIGLADQLTDMTDSRYLLCYYTAGTDMTLTLDIFQTYCTLTVQRYDSQGVYQERIFTPDEREMTFDIKAGERCWFLCSATNISSWNRSFQFELKDQDADRYTMRDDAENGVIYRYNAATGYAEVYELHSDVSQIRLLPTLPGTSVPSQFVPEALFCEIPADTVVYGYEGCPAAEYADLYHFNYIEQPSDGTAAEPKTAGDLNADGRCSEADLVLLMRVTAEQPSLELSQAQIAAADVNGDGMIDLDDVFALRQAVRGAD